MEFSVYKENLKKKYSRYFDVEENYVYKDLEFDIFALSNIRNEKYMISKKFTIFAFENNEYCFVKYFEKIDEKILDKLVGILKESIKDYVDPHGEHMSSTITGIIVVDDLVDNDLIKRIKKFSYQKSFAFGFKGWVDVRLVLVDLNGCSVVTSKKANEVGKFYQP